jgi:Ni2+-binding GTPase involved in maturation of urease and hydrogenase
MTQVQSYSASSENEPQVDPGPTVVTLVGSPGCGKTELICETARRLGAELKIGVALANAPSPRDVQRLTPLCRRVIVAPDAQLGRSQLPSTDRARRGA